LLAGIGKDFTFNEEERNINREKKRGSGFGRAIEAIPTTFNKHGLLLFCVLWWEVYF
jgi:hypothetical protein